MRFTLIILQKCYIGVLAVVAGGFATTPASFAQQQFSAPTTLPAAVNSPQLIAQASFYTVYVNGASDLLLGIVQQVEPAAIVQKYKSRRVIVAGNFYDEFSAQQRVEQLRFLGVQALVTDYDDNEFFGDPTAPPGYAVAPAYIPPAVGYSTYPSYPSYPSYAAAPLTTPINPGYGTGQYQIIVSPAGATLDEVQQIEPEAFFRQYSGQTVIQAGSFIEEINAIRRVEILASRGIPATIARENQATSFGVPTQRFNVPVQPLYQPLPSPASVSVFPLYQRPVQPEPIRQVAIAEAAPPSRITSQPLAVPQQPATTSPRQPVAPPARFVPSQPYTVPQESVLPAQYAETNRVTAINPRSTPLNRSTVSNPNRNSTPVRQENFDIPDSRNTESSNADLDDTNAYYVNLSTDPTQFLQLTQQLQQLGVPAQNVAQRRVSGNTYLAVGPFTNRQTAEQWWRYLRRSGFPAARVELTKR